MIPPSGFKSELYPLRHRLAYGGGLSVGSETRNTALLTLVRHTNDVIAGTPGSIVVNPHNTNYVEDAGPAVCKMSIIDKLSMSLKFNLTSLNAEAHHSSGVSTSEVFTGDNIPALKFLWRPIFFSFAEKLAAADDDTGTTVETILGLTSDATFEDVVPLTTNKLPTSGSSAIDHPVSTVNIAEVFGDYNMTTTLVMEDHVWNEKLFHDALRRYTNKGALASMVGRTRHVTLTRNRPFKNYWIDKFVPRAIRRVQPYSYFGIQIHVLIDTDVEQAYIDTDPTTGGHLGFKLLCNYHEWNVDHFQEMSGTAP